MNHVENGEETARHLAPIYYVASNRERNTKGGSLNNYTGVQQLMIKKGVTISFVLDSVVSRIQRQQDIILGGNCDWRVHPVAHEDQIVSSTAGSYSRLPYLLLRSIHVYRMIPCKRWVYPSVPAMLPGTYAQIWEG